MDGADKRMISTVLSHNTKKSPLPSCCQNVAYVAYVYTYTQSIYDIEECFAQLKIIQHSVYATHTHLIDSLFSRVTR